MARWSADVPAFDRLPAGFRLLCLAASGDYPERQARIEAALAEVDDWHAVIAAARNHHLIPPLSTLLRQPTAPSAPAWVLDLLAGLHERQSRACLKQAHDLSRLCHDFADHGIRCLSIKGTVLSQQLYGDPARRGAGDIDLVIDPTQFPQAQALLRRQGFSSSTPKGVPVDDSDLAMAVLRDLSFRRPDGCFVELHQRLTEDATLLPLDFDTLWQHRRGAAGFPAPVQTLSAEHCALYLVAHGGEHAWGRLRWLADLTAVFADPDLHARVDALAATLSLAPALREALGLAGFFLQGRPAEALDAADCRRIARYCRWFVAGTAWTQPAHGDARPGLDRLRHGMRVRWYQYTLRRTWKGAWSRFHADLTAPVDWHLFRLPKGLHWLYPALRPLGWLLRHAVTAGRKGTAAAGEDDNIDKRR